MTVLDRRQLRTMLIEGTFRLREDAERYRVLAEDAGNLKEARVLGEEGAATRCTNYEIRLATRHFAEVVNAVFDRPSARQRGDFN